MENVDFQPVVEALEARIARLATIVAGLKAEMGQADGGAVEVTPATGPSFASMPVIHADTFYGLSIIDAAKKYLKMARRAQHTASIADALAKGGLKRPDDGVLSSVLIRAAKGREVTKVGKATWGLPEWYPRAPKEDNGESSRKAGKPGRKRTPVAKKPRDAAPASKKSQELTVPAGSDTKNEGRPLSPLMRDVLLEAGKPLHTKEVTSRVNALGKAATKATVEGLLRRWVKDGKAKKTGPSTFTL